MEIENYIIESHNQAIARGDYKCQECGGKGGGICKVPQEPDEINICKSCNGTGINPNRNIGEMLFEIIFDLCCAAKAHKNNNFAIWKTVNFIGDVDINVLITGLNQGLYGAFNYYGDNILNTFEDRLASAFIKLFDLCGYHGRVIQYSKHHGIKTDNIAEYFYKIMLYCLPYWPGIKTSYKYNDLFSALLDFCTMYNIDIEQHIKAKLAYNKLCMISK